MKTVDATEARARKPMFALKSADGAIGAHTRAVADAYETFSSLALVLLARCGLAQRVSA